MSRIRSIHPGLFTDESFVSVSDAAQIFYIGLLTEADDQGVFEWKPLTLKMRLRPASLQPVNALLEELAVANRIAPYEVNGRKYGALRNFRKFQRPKFPNSVHPITESIRSYVGLSGPITEIDGVDDPTFPLNGETERDDDASFQRNAEKSFQMEEGGESRRMEKKDSPHTPQVKANLRARGENPRAVAARGFETWWEAYPHKVGKGAAAKAWSKAAALASVAELSAGVDRYVRTKPPDREWCNPATWLNQQRWLDAPTNGADHFRDEGPDEPAPKPEDIWPESKEVRH